MIVQSTKDYVQVGKYTYKINNVATLTISQPERFFTCGWDVINVDLPTQIEKSFDAEVTSVFPLLTAKSVISP